MRQEDFDEFSSAINDAYTLLDRAKLAPAGMALMFRLLEDVTLEEFKQGLAAHLRDPEVGQYAPTVAHIRAQILENQRLTDGRPTADEAWSIAVAGADEAVTIVTNTEIATAWANCSAIYAIGDEVGARLAFRESYNREVSARRQQKLTPLWFASLGHDPQLRETALIEGVRLGRLTKEQARLHLPNVPSRQADKLLPAPKDQKEADAQNYVKAKLAELKAKLKFTPEPTEDRAAAEPLDVESSGSDTPLTRARMWKTLNAMKGVR